METKTEPYTDKEDMQQLMAFRQRHDDLFVAMLKEKGRHAAYARWQNSAKYDFLRTCSACGVVMFEGYYAEGEYYHNDECLHTKYTTKEWDELCEDGDSDSYYWTEWDKTECEGGQCAQAFSSDRDRPYKILCEKHQEMKRAGLLQ